MIKHTNSFPRHMQKLKKGSSHVGPALNIFLGLACLVLGTMYLVQMNNLTVQGFVLKELKSKASILAEENEDLQAKALNLQSYGALSPRLRNLNMVAVDEIIYLNSETSVVAKK